MKKFPKIIAALLLVSLFCGVIAVSVAATSGSESVAETNQLTDGATTNVYAFDFDDPSKFTSASVFGTTAHPADWFFNPSIKGGYSLAFRYDGADACSTANGINADFPFAYPKTTDGQYSGNGNGLSGANYDYVTFDVDFGTDAYAYTDANGVVKTYTLYELSLLEKGEAVFGEDETALSVAEQKALAKTVKEFGVPAYTDYTQAGPVAGGQYTYFKTVQGTDGRYKIYHTATNATLLSSNTGMLLSNQVGVYDHLTYVYDLNGDGTNVYLYIYLNGEIFLVYKLGIAKSAFVPTIFRMKANTNVNASKLVGDGRYLQDSYSMVVDNMTVNYYDTADATTAGIEGFFSKVTDFSTASTITANISSIKELTGMVFNNNYKYGDGTTLAQKDAAKTGSIWSNYNSYDNFDPFLINNKTAFAFQNYGAFMGNAEPSAFNTKGAINGKYTLPNGNNVYRIYTDGNQDTAGYQNLTANSDMYWNIHTSEGAASFKLNTVDYFVASFDFATDMYLYNGTCYSLDDVAALKASDDEANVVLAGEIEANGVAAYLPFGQFGNIYGEASKVGDLQSYMIPVLQRSGNSHFIEAPTQSNLTGAWFNNVTLSSEVLDFHNFATVFVVDHTTPANSACYFFYDGELVGGAKYNYMDLTKGFSGLKFNVNASRALGGVVMDNLSMKLYNTGYSSGDAYGIDDFFADGFIGAATEMRLYDCEDVTYNVDYVTPNGGYVSLNNNPDTTAHNPQIYDRVLADVYDGDTIYVSGTDLLNFSPELLPEQFYVVCQNGGTFTPGSKYVIEETVEDAVEGTVTYNVVISETTAVVWQIQVGEELVELYTEEYKKGTVISFKPSEVIGGVSQYASKDLKTGSIKTLSENSKFTVEYVDGDVFDEATGTITDNNGYVALIVDYSVEYLPFVFFDAQGEPVGDEASYGSTSNFRTLYNANKASIATIKFFGNGEDIIYINMVTNNSLIVNNQNLTVDLNGQRVWFGVKKDDATTTVWSPMFQVQNGATLNIINGHLFHVTRYTGASWAGNSDKNIYTPSSFVAVDSGAATVNFGVKGDNTKALNFYGSSILKVLAGTNSVNLGIYGGLVQSDNFFLVHGTNNYAADGIIDIRSGENTVEILDSTIIDNVSNAVFNLAAEATVTTTVTNSTVICKTINKNGKQPLVNTSTTYYNPVLFKSAAASGTTTFVNSTIISPAHVGTEAHKVILEAGTKTNWAADSVNKVAASGLSVVLGSQAYSESFFMAENFQPIHNSLYGNGKSDLFDVDLLSVGYMDLGYVAYTDTITSAVIDASESLPEGVTYVIYQDGNGEEIKQVLAFIGSAPVHPDIAIAGTKGLSNGWYDIGYATWKGDAVVAANSVYVPDGEDIIAKFVPTAERIKVGAQIQGHMSFNFYVLNELENIEITAVVNDTISEANLNDVAYTMGTQNTNSTKLGFEDNFTIKYKVTLDSGYTEELSVSVYFKSTSYFDTLVNAVANGDDKYGTGWEKSLAAYLQYRYYSYLAAGNADYEDAKTIYEGYFVTLEDYLPNLTAELPQLDIDKEVPVDKGTFADYIVAMDYDVGENQPNAHFYLDKAKIDALYGGTAPFVKSAWDVYGYFADTAFTYKTVTPTVTGDKYEEQSGSQQFFILGTTADNVFTADTYTVQNAEGKDVVCYRARIIQGEAANMRATFEFSLKVDEDTTLVGTFSLREYANALDATDADANLKATIKLLYISAVESWNYKVKTVPAN